MKRFVFLLWTSLWIAVVPYPVDAGAARAVSVSVFYAAALVPPTLSPQSDALAGLEAL